MNEINRFLRVHVWRLCSGAWRPGVIFAVILFVFPDAWALDVTPASLSFQAVQGGTNPPSQIVNVLKNNDRTLSWKSDDNVAWLSVSPTTGIITSSTQISVNVNPTGMAVGSYMGTVAIRVVKGGNVSIPVTLTVISASPAKLSSTSPSSSNSTATVTWNPSSSTNVASYTVYMGTASGVYNSSIRVGNVTSYTVTNLGVGNTYYFAVTASNISGVESSFSNEVSKSVY